MSGHNQQDAKSNQSASVRREVGNPSSDSRDKKIHAHIRLGLDRRQAAAASMVLLEVWDDQVMHKSMTVRMNE